MPVRSVDAVERSVHKTNKWLPELTRELGTETDEVAWRILRAYLQILRDRLTVDVSQGELNDVLAQRPREIRGVLEPISR
jgi:uncharacterized protein (DUF2267 family)